MEGVYKINWVVCPQCKYRYYVGQQLLEKGIPAICPKCRLEFDPVPHLESPKFKASRSIENKER